MGTWSDVMNDTVTVAPRGAEDDYGKHAVGTQRTLTCRIEYDAKDVRDADGNIIATRDIVYTHDSIGRQEFVWLPGANTSNADEAKTPFSVKQASDLANSETLWEVVV